MKKKTAIVIGLILLAGLLLAMILPALTSASNCGGNSDTLNVCRSFSGTAEMTAQDNLSKFEIGKIGKIERQSLSRLAEGGWGVSGKEFLIRTNFIFGNDSNREIVIVCKTQFGNVPQPTLWNFYRQNPAHAVGYSDGTSGLISPEQFKNLNLASFVTLSDSVAGFKLEPSKP